MTRAGIHKRSRPVLAAAFALLCAATSSALAPGTLDAGVAFGAANPGGASAPGTSTGAATGGSSTAGAGTTSAGSGGAAPGSAGAGKATGKSGGSGKKPASKQHAKRETSTSLHVNTVRITGVKCVPASRCGTNPHEVSLRGTLLIAGRGLKSGLTVAFPRTPRARIASNSPAAHLRTVAAGLEVTVPGSAHSGNIMVLLGGGKHTSSYGPITIVRYTLHPPAPKPPPPTPITPTPTPGGSAFEGQGMWIWYLSSSNGGSVASIAAQAHAADVSTVFVKSSDGSTNYWSQFSPELVAQLHANGLKVCAWQYVYGTNPAGEAALGVKAVESGADCLVIDAEAQYEGRYGAAQTYISDLRAKIGPSYPVGLASFPYVYYHTSFPYSVFLGPGGAQFNAPQMYWKDIGDSVDTVYANTYIANRPYGRPIDPLGQTYSHPSDEELVRFREEAVDYGATGLSWWDWQETPTGEWTALAAPLAPLTSVVPNPGYTELSQGNKGDPVLWMQEHLANAIPTQATTGIFDAATAANLAQFQTAHNIPPTGKTEAATWQALLALPPVAVNWTGSGPQG